MHWITTSQQYQLLRVNNLPAQSSWRLWEQVAYEELCLWWKQVKKKVWGKRRRTRTSCRFAGSLLRTRQRMSTTQQAQREWEGTRPQIHYLGTSHRINWSRKKAGCLEIRRWWRRTEKWESKQDSKKLRAPRWNSKIFSRSQKAHEPPESERFLTRKIA